MDRFVPVIGLEIHIQLKTASKMFCSSPNQTEGVEPNTNICEVCTGQPGSLPVANEEAVKKGILMGLALNCQIAEHSKFDRKNYFYPDLPKGYQISQFDKPVCGPGSVEISGMMEGRIIRITRAHLEEDAGKLLHPPGAAYSLVDFNRAGVPLLEIVTEPDFATPAEAKAFLQQLRTIARYLGVSDADMEKGHLRCDANISLKKVEGGQSPSLLPLPNYKVEIKNMNSFKAVEDALTYEIARQTELLQHGSRIEKETRGWSEQKKQTLSQRSKEGSDDYRYFPEPDLPVLHFTKEFVEELRLRLPELPAAKQQRFVSEYGLLPAIAWQLVEDRALADYFEAGVSELGEWLSVSGPAAAAADKQRLVKEAGSWCVGVFTELLNKSLRTADQQKITPENFAELLKMIEQGEVSKTAAKQVFVAMFETGEDPSSIMDEQGLRQVSDSAALEGIIDEVLRAHPGVMADVAAGKKQAIGFLVGKVMAASRGQANPQVVNELLRKKIL